MNARQLAKTLVDRAMELFRASGQGLLQGHDAMVFDVPQVEEQIYVVLTDAGTGNLTLAILLGDHAREQFEDLMESHQVSDQERLLESPNRHFLSFAVTRMKGLKPEFRRLLDRAGYPPSRMAPVFGYIDRSKEPHPANREQLEIFLAVITGLLDASAAGKLEGRWGLGILDRVRVVGDLRRPEIEVDLVDAITEEDVAREILLAHPAYVDPESLPADDAREAWKAADLALTEKITLAYVRSALANPKAWAFYLGGEGRDDLPQEVQPEATMGYLNWYVTWFRARSQSPTALETLLKKSTQPAERTLIEARMKGTVSLYEVIAPLSELAFEARDLFTGERIDIDDGGLATHSRPGMGLALHVYSIGDFRFAMPIGPWYATGRRDEAMEALMDLGASRPEDLVRAPHLLGHLWPLAQELRHPCLPKLQNRDGDPLLWHKVDFRFSDFACLDDWLQKAEAFEYDENLGQWIWVRDQDRTVLGHLQLIDDHLLAEVNSARRAEKIRSLLEAIPGLAFESLSTQEIRPGPRDDRPLDDQLPRGGDMGLTESPEVLETAQEFMDKTCMAWLDEKIPMLDGKTPRETCATQRGRDQVRHMILTYADPSGMPGLTVPREAMLKELGLEQDCP